MRWGLCLLVLFFARASALAFSRPFALRASNGARMADAPRAAGAPLFCLNVCLRVKPERREEFIACIRNNQRCTLSTEPLAVAYDYGEDASTANTWHFFEKYVGRAGFEQHCATAHFAAWEVFAASDPFTAPPRVDFYTIDSA